MEYGPGYGRASAGGEAAFFFLRSCLTLHLTFSPSLPLPASIMIDFNTMSSRPGPATSERHTDVQAGSTFEHRPPSLGLATHVHGHKLSLCGCAVLCRVHCSQEDLSCTLFSWRVLVHGRCCPPPPMTQDHDTADRELHPVDDGVAGWGTCPSPKCLSGRCEAAHPRLPSTSLASLGSSCPASLLRIQLFGGVMAMHDCGSS